MILKTQYSTGNIKKSKSSLRRKKSYGKSQNWTFRQHRFSCPHQKCKQGSTKLSVSELAQNIAIAAGGFGLQSRADQTGHSVDNGSSPLRRFFGVALPNRQAVEMGPTTRYTLWRNSTGIMKI